jgi:hypothetical protein
MASQRALWQLRTLIFCFSALVSPDNFRLDRLDRNTALTSRDGLHRIPKDGKTRNQHDPPRQLQQLPVAAVDEQEGHPLVER